MRRGGIVKTKVAQHVYGERKLMEWSLWSGWKHYGSDPQNPNCSKNEGASLLIELPHVWNPARRLSELEVQNTIGYIECSSRGS